MTRLVCIAVSQPIGTLYVTSMKAGDLLRRVAIYRRGLAPEDQNYVQRQMSGKRAKDIAAYVGDPDATFPTSIIVAADATKVHPKEIDNINFLYLGRKNIGATEFEAHDELALKVANIDALSELADDEKIGEVIDGQHRLEGLKLAGAGITGTPASEFELPVVFMLDMDPQDRGYVSRS
ncbi:MAG: DGQHR domain-containing protein [Betaproteobacteria bacterium]|nr:DGQHR domain-containing protein [Betaproteobacteria bacterium]